MNINIFIFSTLISLILSLDAPAQNQKANSTSKHKIVYFNRTLGSISQFQINQYDGTTMSRFSDTRMRDERGVVLRFDTIIDALDYLDNIGWELISTHARKDEGTYYVLKKVQSDTD